MAFLQRELPQEKMTVNIKDSEIKMASDFQQQFWKLEDETMLESSKEKIVPAPHPFAPPPKKKKPYPTNQSIKCKE